MGGKNTSITKAIIENNIGSSPVLSEHRKPLKSIGNKNNKQNNNVNSSPLQTKLHLKLNTGGQFGEKKEKHGTSNNSTRAIEEINRYKMENNINLNTPERKQELEKMELRIAALVETNT